MNHPKAIHNRGLALPMPVRDAAQGHWLTPLEVATAEARKQFDYFVGLCGNSRVPVDAIRSFCRQQRGFSQTVRDALLQMRQDIPRHPARLMEAATTHLYNFPVLDLVRVDCNISEANSFIRGGDHLGDRLLEVFETYLAGCAARHNLAVLSIPGGTAVMLIGALNESGRDNLLMELRGAAHVLRRGLHTDGHRNSTQFMPQVYVGHIQVESPELLIDGRLTTAPERKWQNARQALTATRAEVPMDPRLHEFEHPLRQALAQGMRRALVLAKLAEQGILEGQQVVSWDAIADTVRHWCDRMAPRYGETAPTKDLPILYDAQRAEHLAEARAQSMSLTDAQLAGMQVARPMHDWGRIKVALDAIERLAGSATEHIAGPELAVLAWEVGRLYYLAPLAERDARQANLHTFRFLDPSAPDFAEKARVVTTFVREYHEIGCQHLAVGDVDWMQSILNAHPTVPDPLGNHVLLHDDRLAHQIQRVLENAAAERCARAVVTRVGDTLVIGLAEPMDAQWLKQPAAERAKAVGQIFQHMQRKFAEHFGVYPGQKRIKTDAGRVPVYVRPDGVRVSGWEDDLTVQGEDMMALTPELVKMTVSIAFKSGVRLKTRDDLPTLYRDAFVLREHANVLKKAAGDCKQAFGRIS